MAGNASNWIKASGGPKKGQAFYVPRLSAMAPAMRSYIVGRVNAGTLASEPPKGVAQSGGALSAAPAASGTRQALTVAQATLDNPAFLRVANPAMDELERVWNTLPGPDKVGYGATSTLIFNVGSAAGSRGDSVMSGLAQAQGFDGKPTVMPKTQFDAYLKANKGAISMTRGFSETSVTSTAYKDAFKNGDFFAAGTNGRQFGAGVYAADASRAGKATARSFALEVGNSKLATYMRLALKPGAKVIDTAQLDTEHAQWLKQARAHVATVASAPERARQQRLIDVIDYDQGYFASMMGYDAVRTGKGSYNDHEVFVVYNRTALVVQDEYER